MGTTLSSVASRAAACGFRGAASLAYKRSNPALIRTTVSDTKGVPRRFHWKSRLTSCSQKTIRHKMVKLSHHNWGGNGIRAKLWQ